MALTFRDFLVAEGLSTRTVDVYWRMAARARLWFEERGWDLREASPSQVAGFAELIPKSTSSRRQLRSSLQYFWEWSGAEPGPIKAIRVPPKPRPRWRGLEPDQARDLVKTALGWHPQGTAVLLGMYMALRRLEIAEAHWDRFDLAMDWYTVVGKGDVTATLPVHPVLASELFRLYRIRGNYLFPGSRGREHITAATVWNWVREVAVEAGIGLVSPHQMRHTAIATINDVTGDLRATAEFARHARVEDTMRYTRMTQSRLHGLLGALDYLET